MKTSRNVLTALLVVYLCMATPAGGYVGLDFGLERNDLELFDVAKTNDLLDFTGGAAGNSGYTVFVACRIDLLVPEQYVIGNKNTLHNFSIRILCANIFKGCRTICRPAFIWARTAMSGGASLLPRTRRWPGGWRLISNGIVREYYEFNFPVSGSQDLSYAQRTCPVEAVTACLQGYKV